MLGRVWGWFVNLIMIGAGAYVGGFIVVKAWTGELSEVATPGGLWRRLVIASLVMVVISLVISGFSLCLLVAGAGFLVAAVVMLERGEPEYTAPMVVIAVVAALPFLVPRFLALALDTTERAE